MRFTLFLLHVFASFSISAQLDTTLVVYFQTDSFHLSDSSRLQFSEVLEELEKSNDILKVKIIAYCDDVGSQPYNLQLSEKRANTLKELVGITLISVACEAKGAGEIQFVKNGIIKELQRQENRKAEIKITLAPHVVEAKAQELFIDEEEAKEPVPEYLNQELAVGDKIVLDGILFVGNKDIILAESFDNRKALLDQLNAFPNVSVQIQGHIYDPCYYSSDCISPYTNNLSERRAKSIYNYLIESGIDKERLSYIGFEGKYPLNGDPKNDRRVEIEIIGLD